MPTILLVNDLEDNISLIRDALNTYLPNCNIHMALGGREALEEAAEIGEALDLVVLDANMPEVDGFEVCRRLKSIEF